MVESNLMIGTQTLGASSLLPLGGVGTGLVGVAAETVKAAGIPGDLGGQTGDGFRERFEASAGLAGPGSAKRTFVAETEGLRTPRLTWQAPEVEEAMASTLPTASPARGVNANSKENTPAGTVLDPGADSAKANLDGSAGFVGVGSVEEGLAGETSTEGKTGVEPTVEVEAAPVGDGSAGEGAKTIDTRVGTSELDAPLTMERTDFEALGATRPVAAPVSIVKGGVVKASVTQARTSSRVPVAGAYATTKTPSLGPVGKLGDVGSSGVAAAEAAGTSQEATSKKIVVAAQAGAEEVGGSKASEDLPEALHPVAAGLSAVAAAAPAPVEVADATTKEGVGATSAVQGKSGGLSAQASKRKQDVTPIAAPAGTAPQPVGIMADSPLQATMPGGVAVAVAASPALPAEASHVEAEPAADSVGKSNAITSGVRTNVFGPHIAFQAQISSAATEANSVSGATSGAVVTSSGKPASADPEPSVMGTQGGVAALVNDAVRPKTSVDMGRAVDALAGAGKRVTAPVPSVAMNKADGVGAEAIAKDGGAKQVVSAAEFANSFSLVQPGATVSGVVQASDDTKQANGAVKAVTTSRTPTADGVAPSGPLASGAASAAPAVQAAGERVSTAGAPRFASEPASSKPGIPQSGIEVLQHGAVAGVTAQVQPNRLDEAKTSGAGPQGLGGSSRAVETAAAASGGLDHTTLVSTPNVLEVGVASGTNGWLKIRAEMDGTGGVAASVVATTASAAEALHKELPALSAYLRDEAVGVSSLVVNRSEAGAMAQDATANQGAGGFGASSQAGRGGQTNGGDTPMVPDTEAGGVEAVRGSMRTDLAGGHALVTGYGAGSGGWVNVVA